MRYRIGFIVAAFYLLVLQEGCTNSANTEVQKQNVQMNTSKDLTWCDDLIRDYINRSTDELLELERKDTSVHFGWYLDRIESEFGKKYLIFHLGHEVSDEGNTNVRFVTNGWLYIDSLARKLYVYDFTKDTIVPFK